MKIGIILFNKPNPETYGNEPAAQNEHPAIMYETKITG